MTDYCDKHYQLAQHVNIEKDIEKISPELFQYIEVNETTYTCSCLVEKKKQQSCWNDFLKLKQKYK